jgi:hypothetical protein
MCSCIKDELASLDPLLHDVDTRVGGVLVVRWERDTNSGRTPSQFSRLEVVLEASRTLSSPNEVRARGCQLIMRVYTTAYPTSRCEMNVKSMPAFRGAV